MIGIIGAMDLEVSSLCDVIEEITIAKMSFRVGKIFDTRVVIGKCGAGKVNAALCAQILICNFHVDFIINIGVAGGLNSDLDVCDIIIADSSIQTDIDTTSVGDPLGLVSGINQVEFKTDNLLKVDLIKAVEKNSNNYIVGKVATNDQFINSDEKKKMLRNTFRCDACDMEAGAVGHICYMYDVPYIVMKSISDKADNSSHLDYSDFLKLACENSKDVLRKFICIYEKRVAK